MATVNCVCKSCGGLIAFESERDGETITCPHCSQSTQIDALKPPLLDYRSNLTIGDISISGDKIITPNGIGSLAKSQWIFSDMSRVESRIPTTAIILAIVFALLCLIGLLFLLIREEKVVG